MKSIISKPKVNIDVSDEKMHYNLRPQNIKSMLQETMNDLIDFIRETKGRAASPAEIQRQAVIAMRHQGINGTYNNELKRRQIEINEKKAGIKIEKRELDAKAFD